MKKKWNNLGGFMDENLINIYDYSRHNPNDGKKIHTYPQVMKF